MNQDELYLRPIIDAADVIASSVTVGREQFLADTLREDAVIRRLEAIGEATKRRSPELRARHSDIAWRRIAGMRDVLIHNSMGVDLVAVWGFTQQRVPELRQLVAEILAESESPSSA